MTTDITTPKPRTDADGIVWPTITDIQKKLFLGAFVAMQIKELYQPAIERVERELAEAKEVANGIAYLKSLSAEDGAMRMRVELNPELAQWQAHCFANLVAGSPNYTEVQFEVRDPANGNRITVTVQKQDGKTPHELRREAEAERDSLRSQLTAAQQRISTLEKEAGGRIEQNQIIARRASVLERELAATKHRAQKWERLLLRTTTELAHASDIVGTNLIDCKMYTDHWNRLCTEATGALAAYDAAKEAK